jgi:hypothetical protein
MMLDVTLKWELDIIHLHSIRSTSCLVQKFVRSGVAETVNPTSIDGNFGRRIALGPNLKRWS